MTFAIPTTAELIDEVASYFEGADFSNGSSPRLRATIEYVLTRVQAQQIKDLYGFLEFISNQAFPDTADEENFWHWAGIWGVFQKTPVAWEGTYEFAGTNGTLIPDGTQLVREDGASYITVGDETIASGIATATIRAELEGEDSECEDGQILELSSPISGVTGAGTVQSTTINGTDLEDHRDGLVRLLARIRTPPSGGGPGDYERWALEVGNNTRAWEFALLEGPNSVSVAFTRDNESPIVPDSTERAETLAYIETKAPITVDVRIITLSAVAVNLVFSSLTPNTTAVQDAIEEAVKDLLYRSGGPGETITLSQLNQAISNAAEEIDHVLTAPSANLVFATNEVGVIGTITPP